MKKIISITMTLLLLLSITLTGCSSNSVKDTSATADNIAYAITENQYRETDNLSEAVKKEFGSQATIADWSDIKKDYGDNIEEFIKEIGFKYGENESVFVTNEGQESWKDNRHYFITRFDGTVPSGYLVHEQIQKNVIVLGSWVDINYKILVKTNESL
ncbi:MAG: hypothetical protein WCR27_07310 [Eubacteriales bacterium]